jgi:uncharacterized protein (DUF4415 family)
MDMLATLLVTLSAPALHLGRGGPTWERKVPISIRLDPDVLAWFRSLGKGYQTHINAVLRTYMQAKQNSDES